MKNIKALTALLMALMLTFSLFTGALADEEPDTDTQVVALGDSVYQLTLPLGFYEVSFDDAEERFDSPIQSFVSEDNSLVIDIYEDAKTEDTATLAAYMEKDCAEYNGTDLTAGSINGIETYTYRCTEQSDDVVFDSITCGFEFGDTYVEADFTWSDPACEQEAMAILETLGVSEGSVIALGTSGYTMTANFTFEAVDISEQEASSSLMNSYFSPESGLIVDVYEFPVSGETAFEESVAAQAEAYGAMTEPIMAEVNGIPCAGFIASRLVDGTEVYATVFVFENPNGGVTDVVAFLSSYANLLQANALFATLNVNEEYEGVELTDEESFAPMTLELGTSLYTIDLPMHFYEQPLSEDSLEDGHIADYFNPHAMFDFTVYVEEDGIYDSLAAFNEADAASYAGTEIDSEMDINGIPVAFYHSEEVMNESVVHCDNYAFETDNGFMQLCFYYSDAEAEADVEAAIETLKQIDKTTIRLGSSQYLAMVSESFTAEDVETESEGVSAVHYESASAPLCFYVYEFTGCPETSVVEYTTASCEKYAGTNMVFGEINDIEVGHYEYARSDSSMIYTTILPNGEGSFIELDFVVDGYIAYSMMIDILSSIAVA